MKTPSAPPLENAPIDPPRETVRPLQATDPNAFADQPPPPYQEALNYPQAPPYPSYEPNNFPSAPHPTNVNFVQPNYPPYPNYTSASVVPPTPMPTTTYQTAHPQPNVTTTHHIHHTTVLPNRPNPCSFCTGTVDSETDICCLLCLILLAIFTFPFGLVLLFCIPCTIRKRCNTCRRIYD